MWGYKKDQDSKELLATVSHDLRNYLQLILGWTEVLLQEQEKGSFPVEETLLNRIRRAALSGHLLVSNYFDLVRLETNLFFVVKMPVQVDKLLQQTLLLYEADALQKQISLGLQLPKNLPIVLGDETALGRAVSNLLHNAVKFTPSGGRITVSVALLHQNVAIMVEDTGDGIAPADLSSIFIKGWCSTASRSAEGTGLGLFIAKTMAEAHGGRISVESMPNRGSRFTIFLPYQE